MTDFETIRLELPSGRSVEGQRETRHSVWLEDWELAETGDVVRIDGATWRVDDLHRARIGGQRATRLHLVRESDGRERVEEGMWTSGVDREVDSGPDGPEAPSPSRRWIAGANPATGRELERRLTSALGHDRGDVSAGYASELGALLRLTAHMERLGYHLSYTRLGDAPIAARVETLDGSRAPLEASGATVADALCRVSLAALERWEGTDAGEDARPPPRPPSRRPGHAEGDAASDRTERVDVRERG